MTFRPSKIELPPRRQLDFCKIDVFDPKVVLRMSWGSLGPLLGALGGLLGAFWAPLRCSWGSLGTTLGAATLSNSYCFLSSLPGQTVGKHFESSSCLFLSFLLSFFPSLVRNEDVSCETLLFPPNVEDVSGGNPFFVSILNGFWWWNQNSGSGNNSITKPGFRVRHYAFPRLCKFRWLSVSKTRVPAYFFGGKPRFRERHPVIIVFFS